MLIIGAQWGLRAGELSPLIRSESRRSCTGNFFEVNCFSHGTPGQVCRDPREL